MKKPSPHNNEFEFSRLLLQWNRKKNDRQMPWKGEKDPYKIWLSEIILQQTRVEQGLAYYQKFILQFPEINKLAKATDDQVFKLWEGLGYYSRCRNLIFTARYISEKLNGNFPATFEDIIALKGVGSYTASAIASFAYNLPYAVLDGNVFRVLARYFGISTSIDSNEGRKIFSEKAFTVLDKKNPGTFNQAIMDFGAVICKPALPLCKTCVLRKGCYAFTHDAIADLPVKKNKLVIKTRFFNYLIIDVAGNIAITQRTKKDIWQSLFEFPLIETEKELSVQSIQKLIDQSGYLNDLSFTIEAVSELIRQKLTHQWIHGRFIRIKLHGKEKPENENNWVWTKWNSLDKFSFPKIIHQYLATIEN
jgi:A/G-specific adenine glycosylase